LNDIYHKGEGGRKEETNNARRGVGEEYGKEGRVWEKCRGKESRYRVLNFSG